MLKLISIVQQLSIRSFQKKKKERKEGKQYKKQLSGKNFIHKLFGEPFRSSHFRRPEKWHIFFLRHTEFDQEFTAMVQACVKRQSFMLSVLDFQYLPSQS